MGEIMGLGCTHAPHLQFTDGAMANVFKRTLASERTPALLRQPANWPEGLRAEWAEDEGLAAASRHRARLLESFRKARQALDEFQPDFVLIWGDDQYENFRTDLLTPFCVFAAEEFELELFKPSRGLKAEANVWGEETSQVVHIPGHQPAAQALAAELIQAGFDVSCAFRPHHSQALGHAFTRTVLYLDYDRRGFGYPIVPFHVNCYGANLRVPPEDGTNSAGQRLVPPPAPPPWRCYDLGKAVAGIIRDTPWRAAVIGSSSWSHATLTAKHHFLYPDVETDHKRLAELESGDVRSWRTLRGSDLTDAGQHETLNWICLAGAMEGSSLRSVDFAETYLFNSDKALAIWEPR